MSYEYLPTFYMLDYAKEKLTVGIQRGGGKEGGGDEGDK